ncbi:Phage tail assembly chaperone protein [uncultured Caudovirales phage]|uniref:Phage tail assembly chaperone protein n=1 Tax=uncultured Caudovirales phage TaxID=2100421 RepID=A0A6J5LI79_9CAUD|nr:Phage tail assembly chaperone protein [uncultured Caudovirales phage]CAB4242027.1 Phage tail assembly chaperone protein [uncultured Caudovirales phage]
MKALISPIEADRICEIVADDQTFPIAEPLFWVTCPNDCQTDWIYSNGQFYPPAPKPIIDPNLTDEQKMALIVAERDKRLIASDWTQLADVIALHSQSWILAWNTYRQELRDLPNTVDINNPLYPIPPLE